MRRRAPVVTILLVVAIIAQVATAAEPQAGRESLFLLGAGARALGMGGAYAALADHAEGVFWNPAGLSLLEHRELNLMHVSLYEETSYDFVAAAWPILDFGTVGIAGARLGSNNIEFRDKYGPLGNHDYSTGQYWVSYARGIYRSLHGGINFKLINENLGNLSATTAGIDAGLLCRFWDMISVGANYQDAVSGKLKLLSVEEEIPSNIKTGLAVHWQNKDAKYGITAAGDIDMTENQPARMHLGCELMAIERLFARAGYDREYMTFGIGVRYKLAAMDYAYKGNDVLGGSHRLSLTLFFGPTISEQKIQRAERDQAHRDDERFEHANDLWQLAEEAFHRNELDSAMTLCNQVLGYDPNHEKAQNLLENIRELVHRRAAEEIDSQSRAKARDDMVRSRVNGGLQLLDEGKLGEARVEFNEVLKLDPENVEARDGLARIDTEIDRLVRAYTAEGDARFSAKDYGEAVVAWNKALELKPDQSDIRRRIENAKRLLVLNQKLRDAVEAYSDGEVDRARELFDEVLSLDPQNATALRYIETMNQKDVPVVLLDELKSDQEYWDKYLEGLTLFRDKKYEEAIAVWQAVLEKYPGSRETRANIEQARLRMEQ
jgi:cytochrome c-type biogenesis protein CcmH/NrfG